MSELAVIVPVLGRPHRVEPLLASIRGATPECTILFIADPDDDAEIAALEAAGAEFICEPGSYAHKINFGIAQTTEPLIFSGADDLDFKAGWYEAAKAKLTNRVAVVGTQDCGHRWVKAGKHATHVLTTREYVERYGTIDEPGKLFHEGYYHVCCDIELVETAKARGAWAFAHEAVVEHLHPFWGKGEMDATYERAYESSRRAHDRALLKRRRPLWSK